MNNRMIHQAARAFAEVMRKQADAAAAAAEADEKRRMELEEIEAELGVLWDAVLDHDDGIVPDPLYQEELLEMWLRRIRVLERREQELRPKEQITIDSASWEEPDEE